MQNKLVFPLIAAALLSFSFISCAAKKVKPELPCRTPQQLKQALDYALNANDTNVLWQLYTWTNVTPALERVEKRIQLQFHPEQAGDWSVFKSFRIVTPPPPDIQEIATRTDPTKARFNIPVRGVIYCDQKMRKGSLRSSFGHMEFPFGQLPDGTCVVAVMIKPSKTNSPAK
jgi:hypothetical protein